MLPEMRSPRRRSHGVARSRVAVPMAFARVEHDGAHITASGD